MSHEMSGTKPEVDYVRQIVSHEGCADYAAYAFPKLQLGSISSTPSTPSTATQQLESPRLYFTELIHRSNASHATVLGFHRSTAKTRSSNVTPRRRIKSRPTSFTVRTISYACSAYDLNSTAYPTVYRKNPGHGRQQAEHFAAEAGQHRCIRHAKPHNAITYELDIWIR